MTQGRFIGKPVPRKEDLRMIQGLGRYIDDLDLPRLHHVVCVRSPFAHARIASIDASAAREHPGVVAIFSGDDTRGVGSVPRATAIPEELHSPRCPVLAEGKVRFMGEPVVAIVARTQADAQDAAELLDIDYEPLDTVASAPAALESGAPLVHDELGTNLAFDWTLAGGEFSWDEAKAKADRVVECAITHQRLAPIALEPRGCMAQFDPGTGEVTLWTSTQIPHLVRTFASLMLGISETKLRVIAPDVGGGFGSKLNVYREEGLLAFIAMQTGLSVKWIERRHENFQATIHGRGQHGVVRVAVKNDGKILGLHYEVVADLGAYHQLLTPAMPAITGLMLSGAYAIPHVTIHVRGAFTHRMSTDAYRGAGRPEATFTVERAVDLVAHELDLDPIDVRRRNFPTEFPYQVATGLSYDSGDYIKTLDKVLEVSDYAELRREQTRARSEGRLMGIGISTYVEICALGPSGGMPTGGFGWESATVRVHPTGSVSLLVGTSPHGQGQETSFAQIGAEMLGLEMDQVDVVHGDTRAVQYGVGTFGSRGTAVGGTALFRALEKVRDKALVLAAHLLGAQPDQVTYADATYAFGEQRLTWSEVAFAAHTAAKLPKGLEPGLKATHFFEPDNFTFPFGAHLCVVDVDEETGKVSILKYVAVDDCGRVINPMLVDGQVQGGIAQGLGQALQECVVYDDDGQLLTGSLMDYALPKASQLPRFELHRTVTPSPVNPLGVKGVGEAGTIGSTPALVNAVMDALRVRGIRTIDMPLTPHRVWTALQEVSR